METICSEWKVTWEPAGVALVLLDFGSPLLGELELSSQPEIQVQPFVRSAHQAVWHRGNEVFTLEFSRLYRFSTAAEANNFRLSHHMTISALRHAEVSLAVKGGDTRQFAEAAISGTSTQGGPALGIKPRVVFRYSVTASKLT